MKNSQIIWYWVFTEYLLPGMVASLWETPTSLSDQNLLEYTNCFYGWSKPHESYCKIGRFKATMSLGTQLDKHWYCVEDHRNV